MRLLSDPKRSSPYTYSNVTQMCRQLSATLAEEVANLTEIDEANIFNMSSGSRRRDSMAMPMRILIAKLRFLQASLTGIERWEELNEDYISALEESYCTFASWHLVDMSDLCLKQFAKLFMKNAAIAAAGNTSKVNLSSGVETDLFKGAKAYAREVRKSNRPANPRRGWFIS